MKKKGNTANVNRLSKMAFGLSLGTIWGLSMFVMAILASCCKYGVGFVKGVGHLYIGYEASVGGAFIGLIWGFFDFFIFGFLIALLYNWFCCCCSKYCKYK